jgi:hypothetical protein
MINLEIENRLKVVAKGMEYPRTPNIAEVVEKRLSVSIRPHIIPKPVAWSLAVVLALLSSLLLIPTTRAAVIEFIQIGIVRIFPNPEVNPAGTKPTPLPEFGAMTAIPGPAPSPLLSLLDKVAGETKLANVMQIASYPILLPSYPPGLGQPNHVYVQDAQGPMTILVWTDPQEPRHAILSLHFIPAGSWAINKMAPNVIQESQVNGARAIWAVGPYPLFMRNGDMVFTRLIEGNVLIWADDKVTYRLETSWSLEEAVKIAESLASIP